MQSTRTLVPWVGDLAHAIVMQHEGKETIDLFIADIQADIQKDVAGTKQ